MSDVFCKQCGVTDDQQAKCDDGCGATSRVSRRLRLFFSEHIRALDSDHAFRLQFLSGDVDVYLAQPGQLANLSVGQRPQS